MEITNLKAFAEENGIYMTDQAQVISEAANSVAARYGESKAAIKGNFDRIVFETEQIAHQIYLKHETEYGKAVFSEFVRSLLRNGEVSELADVGPAFGRYFHAFDRFFLSLSQSRRSRAGSTLEEIIRSLFRKLNYPFDEQRVIDGKPDFVMPSEEHFRENPVDCIVFTVKRTLRERWRQITTEGTQGLGFFLATIDDSISPVQLEEMRDNRIYIVCPARIRHEVYSDAPNVLSFSSFFLDHLDPALDRWRRNGVL